jgi:nucleoside-diphosphate-sugar epimerase
MFSKNTLYKKDIIAAASYNIDWNRLKNKKILITGASGLIGTFMIDVLMYRNNVYNDNITIYAFGRNKEKFLMHFTDYAASNHLCFFQHDLLEAIKTDMTDIDIDYIIHGASNTHPFSYATDPVNTILLSIIGTKNVLDFAAYHKIKRTLFLSSVEIYGENRKDVEKFSEDYCGYINSNTLRAGYPEGKRAAESLCQAYICNKSIDVVIARCCRVYGPTMGIDDSKVVAQFLRNAALGEPIVLKSKGKQQYSYCYVADICTALLVILLNGENSEAYNIADSSNKETLLQLAKVLAEFNGKDIIFEVPSAAESAGYSKVTKALLDSCKLEKLGWKPAYQLSDGLIRTVKILRDL